MLRLRFVLVAFIVGLLPSVSLQAEKKSAAGEPKPGESTPALEMSPFEVAAEKAGFKGWLKVSSPNYILYTDASKREATTVIRRMEMMRQAVQFYLRRRSMKLPPVIAVLPTERSDWNKIRTRSDVKWEVASSMVGISRNVILLQTDWELEHLETFWSMVGHQQLDAMNLDGPFWFHRGMLHFFASVAFTSDSLTIGRQGPLAIVIHEYGWMDWPTFYATTYRSPVFLEDSRDHDRYEAQCEVFTHYALTHPDPKVLPRFLAWATYLDAGNPATDESFKELFQCSWAQWQDKIDDMFHGGTYTTATIKFPPAALQFAVTATDVGEREMRELFVVSQILNQDTKESNQSLTGILNHGVKTPLLRELVPDACSLRGRRDEALKQFRLEIEAGSTNPLVYSEAAKRLFQNTVPNLALEARIEPGTAAQIQAWCTRALELEPLLVDANEKLAWTCALSANFDPANLPTIAGICHKLDGTTNTDEALTAMAVARWRNGNTKQARAIAQRVASSVFTRPQARHLATDLLAQIDKSAAADLTAALPGGPATPHP